MTDFAALKTLAVRSSGTTERYDMLGEYGRSGQARGKHVLSP